MRLMENPYFRLSGFLFTVSVLFSRTCCVYVILLMIYLLVGLSLSLLFCDYKLKKRLFKPTYYHPVLFEFLSSSRSLIAITVAYYTSLNWLNSWISTHLPIHGVQFWLGCFENFGVDVYLCVRKRNHLTTAKKKRLTVSSHH